MKYPTPLLVAVVILLVASAVRVAAQPVTPPAASAQSNPFTQFSAVVARITEKAKSGPIAYEDIAPELGELDAILADLKSEEYASLYLLRARVYMEFLEDYPKSLALLKEVKTTFPKAYSNGQVGKIVNSLEEKMASDNTLYPGKIFPPLSEKDLNGKPVSLAKLKGKVVLVSFWASWSGQCVAELTTQAALYQKYHDKGFEIVGISVDEDRNDLMALLQKRQITWPQICDGRGWKGRLVRQYGVSGVPFWCLVDGEGKIISKYTRGPALEQKLAKLFGN